MRVWWLCLALIAGPAAAMTSEDCQESRSAAIRVLPMASDFALLPGVTPDGWCRIGAAPLDVYAGVEWQAEETADGFTAQARQSGFRIGVHGAFSGTVSVAYDRDAATLTISGLHVKRDDGDGANLALRLDGVDLTSHSALMAGLGTVAVSDLSLRITGRSGLVGEALAQGFGVDRKAAASNFTVAGDQRKIMEAALDELPQDLGDAASRADFTRMIRAYPAARGTAEFAIPAGNSINVGAFLRLIFMGEAAKENAFLEELGKAGLTFRWTD